MTESDWDALQAALWQVVKAHDARVGETAEAYAAAIREALREAGYTLDAAAAQVVEDWLDAAQTLIRDGVQQAVRPIAEATIAPALRSEWIAQRMSEAYSRRWPDGLTLSRRIWAWQELTRRGVSDRLAEGVRVGRAVNGILYDLQRAIEASVGERFARVTIDPQDWADRLRDAARLSIHSRGAADAWSQAVNEALAHIDGLRVGGTRRQAEATLTAIREAVRSGRLDLVDRALDWWLYDRQLYNLRRVVRTEMATAHHRAVITSSLEDADVLGYRWRLSSSHPEWDICDVYAGIELGFGKGVFPKDQVPAGKAHPHCMCSLTPTTRRRQATEGTYSLGDLIDANGDREIPVFGPDMRPLRR